MLRRIVPTGTGVLLAVALLGGCGADDGRAKNFDGPWARHTIDNSGRGADGVRVADVNGDGLPDVAVGWEQEGETRAYLHPGTDVVREPWPMVSVGDTPSVEDAVWADLDGDGQTDVVSSSEGSTQTVFFHFAPSDPSQFFDPSAWQSAAVPASFGRRWMYALPMDVDGKNGIDLIVGGKREGAIIGWLESPADPRDVDAWKLHELSEAGWIMSLDAVDMNNDGLLDILISDRAGRVLHGVRWLERPSDPDLLRQPWANHFVGAQHRSPVFISTVPSGALSPHSVVVPSGSKRLTLYEREDEEGLLWTDHSLPYPERLGTPKSVAVGDVDLDGVLDVVLACTNLDGLEEGIVWLSHGALVSEPEPEKFSVSGAQGQKFDRMELLDLDGDGDLDVLTTEEVQDLGVIWYENPLLP